MEPRTVMAIAQNWKFKQADKEDSTYLPVGQFPTNVHLDLLANKLIPDPSVGKNELDVQWVGEAAWLYRTTFTSPPMPASADAVLAFDGLDTFAKVDLNGTTILQSDNMFTPERVNVTKYLRREGENELVISFDSAYLKGWRMIEDHPEHTWGSWNGDNSRLAVRKAQYHWGWDWGPTLLTCGPWRPIKLEICEARLADLWCDVVVDKSLKSATLITHTSVEGVSPRVRFDVSLDSQLVHSQLVDGTDATFTIRDPALWYPIRYGKPTLYTIKASLVSGGEELDSITKRVGLRRAELVQRALKDQPGTSFFFEINNIPIFCGGSNWIPADNFLPRISRERYYDWVKMVADGNQVMIRVWGGGIYEEQHLYDACDELGILVWQDFMFGCGNYPAYPSMLESIKREAQENVKLLRHHPSIVIYAGNNEDYQYAESEGLSWAPDDHDAGAWLKTNFPARYIYETLLPDVCAELVPSVHYHPGSPWGGINTCDPTVGDIHQWNIWHGRQEKYQNCDKLVGRFVSEFGMQAFPSVKTIDSFLPLGKEDPDRYPQSSTLDFHNKAEGQERRIALYLVENMRYAPDPLEQFVYCTQLMQAECLASAYRLWKRQWKGTGREYCAGALVWQLNDCWPATSWAMCDYYLRPKHAYFAVKREMAPLTVAMTRTQHQRPRNRYTRVDIDVQVRIDIWASNLTLDDVVVDYCLVKAWDVETGRETFTKTMATKLLLPKNQSTEIAALNVPAEQAGDEAKTVLAAYLVRDGEQVARYVNWPEPLKYLHLPRPRQLTARLSDDLSVVAIRADVPVKGVALESEDDQLGFDDNLVDVVPGETVTVAVKGATRSSTITTRYLGFGGG